MKENKKKSLKIVMLSSNESKIKEAKEILGSLGIEVKSYKEVFGSVPTVVEDGKTFRENAIKKVKAAKGRMGHIYIAEDSGIEVEGLGGKPGIRSARYAGEDATREMMCNKILKELGDSKNRRAQFQAAIAIRYPDETIETVRGVIRGDLTYEIKGDEGFGYDPIFIPKGYTKTFGELSKEIKNRLSHRYKALIETKEKITNNLLKHKVPGY